VFTYIDFQVDWELQERQGMESRIRCMSLLLEEIEMKREAKIYQTTLVDETVN